MIRSTFAAALIALPAVVSAQSLPLPPPANHAPYRPSPPSPCVDAAHRQFSFWVGSWNVTATGATKVIAHSQITSAYAGCAILEHWAPIGQKADGGSISSYVPAEHAWRQTWVDSSGARAEFKGGWDGQAMVLTGPWPLPDGRARIVRMTYTPGADGSVRQAGEASFDDGRTWTPSFDFTYRPTPGVRPQPFLKR
ncbi:hypothetical protein [Phenylobacterium sp.]|uniref:hypothetical protein n=1 Tax=Phenylobacterium sp. TaxID=1871053 RepID=UPI002DF72CED|nr:hypothetical protein [Phenylobacterium sp.]